MKGQILVSKFSKGSGFGITIYLGVFSDLILMLTPRMVHVHLYDSENSVPRRYSKLNVIRVCINNIYYYQTRKPQNGITLFLSPRQSVKICLLIIFTKIKQVYTLLFSLSIKDLYKIIFPKKIIIKMKMVQPLVVPNHRSTFYFKGHH